MAAVPAGWKPALLRRGSETQSLQKRGLAQTPQFGVCDVLKGQGSRRVISSQLLAVPLTQRYSEQWLVEFYFNGTECSLT